jgi:hypothetical protein
LSSALIEFALALSLHIGLEGDYNGIHPHIRYNNQDYIAGAYYNSMNRVSFYAGKRWEHNQFGFELGAVIGYDEIMPVAPYARATYNNLFIAPAAEPDNVGVVVGYEFKW